MENLYKYVVESQIHEAAKRLKEPLKDDEVLVNAGDGKVKVVDKDDFDNIEGKTPKKNYIDNKDRWAVDEPKDDEALYPLPPKEEISKNQKAIIRRMQQKRPFFIIGKAGWGKTSIIKNIAKNLGYTIVTVYLDKCLREDLGGIPVAVPDEDGHPHTVYCLPGWAEYIKHHPEKKILLFFDEFNQAPPDVQNAMFPIVNEDDHTIAGVKFTKDAYLACAAGNYESENSGVFEDMASPLKDRFGAIIEWETETDPTWESSFKVLRSKYEGQLGKEIMDKIWEIHAVWKNPRTIDWEVCEPYVNQAQDIANGETYYGDAQSVYEEITLENKLADKQISKTVDNEIKKLAEMLNDYVIAGGSDSKKGPSAKISKERRNKKASISMIPEHIKQMIKDGMIRGWVYNTTKESDNTKYGVSRENIGEIFDPDVVNFEQISRYVETLEQQGEKFKYETNKEFLKDGYKSAE